MKPTGENNSFALPPALLAEVEAVADEEHRPVEDVVQDAVTRYMAARKDATAPAEALPVKRTPAEAAARLRELRKGTFLPEGETIRSMIEYGRD